MLADMSGRDTANATIEPSGDTAGLVACTVDSMIRAAISQWFTLRR
jgi:hypothetical protein